MNFYVKIFAHFADDENKDQDIFKSGCFDSVLISTLLNVAAAVVLQIAPLLLLSFLSIWNYCFIFSLS